MPDSKDYRLYLDERFEGLSKLMSAHFTNVHDRLDAIEIQTTKTNGTVQKHEKIIIENLPHTKINCPQAEKIEHIEKVLTGEDAIKADRKRQKEDKHSNRVRTLMALGIAVSIIIGIYGIASRKSDAKNTTSVPADTTVKYISVPRSAIIINADKPEWKPDPAHIDSIINMINK